MLKIQINNEIGRESWSAMITSPYSSPFQSTAWYDMLKGIPGYDALAMALSDKGKIKILAVVAIMKEKGLKGFFSRRGIIFGGPLLHDATVGELELFLQNLGKRLRGKVIYLETRNFFDYSMFSEPFILSGWKYVPWLNYRVDLRDPQQVWNRISANRKRQIRTALKNGATWAEASSPREVADFYNILQALYKSKVRKPLPPYEYFLSFFNNREMGKILLVYHEGRAIGGIVCPMLGGRAIYQQYVCGLDSEYRELHPSVMATWAALEYGARNGYEWFDFMGAGSPDEEYGVREFKARFGTQKVEHGRFLKVMNPLLYQTGKLALKVLSKTAP